MVRARTRQTVRIGTLVDAERFVDAAARVCEAARKLGVEGCAVTLHGDRGAPVLAVDNLPTITDEQRLYTITHTHWNDNPASAALRKRIGVFDGEALAGTAFVSLARAHAHQGRANPPLFTPLIDLQGWFGTVVYATPSVNGALEHQLSILATELSVWCTAHGVGRVPELASPELPARQHQVARRAAIGRTNVEIADELGISINTVKLRLKQVFERLHVNNRTELANVLRRLAPLDGVPEGVTRHGAITTTRAPR